MSVANTFKRLGDPARVEIIEILSDYQRPLNVTEISDRCPSVPNVSYHLLTMEKAGILKMTKEGKFRYYELNVDTLQSAVDWLCNLEGA